MSTATIGSSPTNGERFRAYLRHYAAKDIHQIAPFFSDTIRLRDWKICVQGKQAAVDETQANFAASQSIEIEVLHIYESENTVVGELRIVVNGKISAIRAFLGRGDAD